MTNEKFILVPIPEAEFFQSLADALCERLRKTNLISSDSNKVNDNWLTHSEAATYLRKTSYALYKLTYEKKIKYFKRGKSNLYRVIDLEKYLVEGEVKTADEMKNEAHLIPKRKNLQAKK